jgi:hypothetical protein
VSAIQERLTAWRAAVARFAGRRDMRLRIARAVGAVALIGIGVIAFVDASVATALAAVLALGGAAGQLDHNRKTARLTLTYAYQARWHNPEMIQVRLEAAGLLKLDGTDAAARWQVLQTLVQARDPVAISVEIVLGFWEDVAGAYNIGLLDEQLFRSGLAYTMLQNWDRASWLIRKFREDDATVYADWTAACRKLRADVMEQYAGGHARAVDAVARGQDLLEL